MKFSANLGFLWTELPLPEAIRAAKAAGFDAVECHWPYAVPQLEVSAALNECGFEMLGLNTRRGDTERGENGLAALPGRESQARALIDEAVAYAQAIGAKNIHVMAGFASGPAAERSYRANLNYACEQAKAHGITILIEPLNHYDAPGYFLRTSDQAVHLIESMQIDNLKMMFDCYHVQLMEGDLSHRLERMLPFIGHIQFAGVPDRGVPSKGEVNYSHLFQQIDQLGWTQPLGAEYKPSGATQDSLDWLRIASR